MLIWIIDEEWNEYDLEKELLPKEFPGVELRFSGYDYKKDLEEFGYKADGILAQIYADINKEMIDKLENCKGIAVYGGGFDKVDIEACKAKGIHVTNIQEYCAEDLADYVIAGIYNWNKDLAGRSSRIKEDIKNNAWGAPSIKKMEHRISKQTLLIVGFGAIGKVVNEKAKAIGMKVIAYDEFLTAEEVAKYGAKKVSWEEGFSQADVVTIHLKGIEANQDKIGENAFKYMKDTAYLINTSRGRVVNEEDLIKAVKSNKIRGALLDVVKNEPPTVDNPLLSCEGIMVTPHNSYISVESMRALKEYAIGNLASMIRGEKPRDPVC
ncbi:C-terminal binding protein [Peptoniphilus catoniae]|uniref:C-terminal binding protein n=1 Tax=Peptoniphilus catoniae TaxID=1660341 RepID=UPI0010FF0529|nr:C-terminal binding protein [Peptoniphilus catoniae]